MVLWLQRRGQATGTLRDQDQGVGQKELGSRRVHSTDPVSLNGFTPVEYREVAPGQWSQGVHWEARWQDIVTPWLEHVSSPWMAPSHCCQPKTVSYDLRWEEAAEDDEDIPTRPPVPPRPHADDWVWTPGGKGLDMGPLGQFPDVRPFSMTALPDGSTVICAEQGLRCVPQMTEFRADMTGCASATAYGSNKVLVGFPLQRAIRTYTYPEWTLESVWVCDWQWFDPPLFWSNTVLWDDDSQHLWVQTPHQSLLDWVGYKWCALQERWLWTRAQRRNS